MSQGLSNLIMANVRKVKDFGELSRLIQERVKSVADRLQPLNGKTIRVGIAPQEKYPEGTAVAQVARWIEYGTSRMAPRPFMRDAIAENSRGWKHMIRENVKQVASGKGGNYKNSLTSVAKVIRDDIRKSITDYGAVRTGRLRDSIKAEVV